LREKHVGIRVFFVEALGDLQSLLDEMLGAGRLHGVGTATTETEAELWLEEHTADWDLAVVDLMLAQGSGFGVISRARETHPTGCVAVLSSHLIGNIEKRCLKLGADVVFDKANSRDFLRWVYRVTDPRDDRVSRLAGDAHHAANDGKPVGP
jgi:two-component system, OmpR family, response regulator